MDLWEEQELLRKSKSSTIPLDQLDCPLVVKHFQGMQLKEYPVEQICTAKEIQEGQNSF